MTDTASGDVDATFVPKRSHEQRSGINLSAVYKCRVVQIQVTDFWSFRIVSSCIRSPTNPKIEERTLCLNGILIIKGIKVHFTEVVRVGNVFRNREGERKLSVTYGIIPYI